MTRTLSIAVFSGLIALFPAFFVALVLPELPMTRPILAERVCGPGGELNQRVTVRNQTSRSVTHHCRDASGVSSESVSLALFMQGMRLAWPPTVLVIGLVWWSTVLVRRGRVERREAEATRSGVAGGGSGPTVAGGVRGAAPRSGTAASAAAPLAATQAAPPATVTLSRGDLGPETASVVDRMVSGGVPSTQDVSDLLEALAREGTVTSVNVTRSEHTVDLGNVLRDASSSLGRAAGSGSVVAGGAGASAPGGSVPGNVEASLRELQRLRERGLISREEHEARRKAVLERAFG